jgi:hypothetical protein
MVPMSAVAYCGDGFFEFDIRQGGPGAEGAAHGVLHVAEHGFLEVEYLNMAPCPPCSCWNTRP